MTITDRLGECQAKSVERKYFAHQRPERKPGLCLFAAFHEGHHRNAAVGFWRGIESVQDLLDHKHITTTQIYDKRRAFRADSASHTIVKMFDEFITQAEKGDCGCRCGSSCTN
jgi:hypothetical protein